MNAAEFSRFDRVLSPVIILSPKLEFLYANGIAKLQFSVLASSDGLPLYFSEQTLQSAVKELEKGQAVMLPSENGICCSMLLEPVFSSKGELNHVCLHVESLSQFDEGLFPMLSEGELLRLIRREILCPVQDLLRNLCMMEHRTSVLSNPELGQALMGMRKKLLRMSMFVAQTEDLSVESAPPFSLCDVNALLYRCASGFPLLKYTEIYPPCFIPADRDFLLRIFLDVLTALYLRQKPGAHISVSVLAEKHETNLVFQSASLLTPIDKPCEPDSEGFDMGLLSVSRRMARVGGRLHTEPSHRGSVRITLTFPPARMNGSEVVVGHPSVSSPSFFEKCALEYLNMIFYSREIGE